MTDQPKTWAEVSTRRKLVVGGVLAVTIIGGVTIGIVSGRSLPRTYEDASSTVRELARLECSNQGFPDLGGTFTGVVIAELDPTPAELACLDRRVAAFADSQGR